MNKTLLFAIGLFFVAHSASGRVFDFKTESVATFFRGNIAQSFVHKSGFENSSGTGVSFDQDVAWNYGGEFGVLINTRYINFKVGLNVVKPKSLDPLKGTDASGTELYSQRSDIIALMPNLGLEFNLWQQTNQRLYLGVSAGQATIDLQNQYNFTSAGQSAFALEDFTEQGQGAVFGGEATLTYEFLLSDTTTTVIDLGYRELKINSLISKKAVTTFNGPIVEGDVLKNSDGSNRTLNLSGPFIGIGFRFYIKTI